MTTRTTRTTTTRPAAYGATYDAHDGRHVPVGDVILRTEARETVRDMGGSAECVVATRHDRYRIVGAGAATRWHATERAAERDWECATGCVLGARTPLRAS